MTAPAPISTAELKALLRGVRLGRSLDALPERQGAAARSLADGRPGRRGDMPPGSVLSDWVAGCPPIRLALSSRDEHAATRPSCRRADVGQLVRWSPDAARWGGGSLTEGT